MCIFLWTFTLIEFYRRMKMNKKLCQHVSFAENAMHYDEISVKFGHILHIWVIDK